MKPSIDMENFDFGFTAVGEADILAPAVEQENSKVETMYKLIMPLLNNLIKDSETKEYIHWPNRKAKLEEFVAKLNALRSS